MVLKEDVLDTFIAKLVEKVSFSTIKFQEKHFKNKYLNLTLDLAVKIVALKISFLRIGISFLGQKFRKKVRS